MVKRKGTCKVEGCPKYRLNGGYCTKHAKERGIAVGRKCQTEGCEKSAQVGGHCISHGVALDALILIARSWRFQRVYAALTAAGLHVKQRAA